MQSFIVPNKFGQQVEFKILEQDHSTTYEAINILEGKTFPSIPPAMQENINTVWDIGANTGAFSYWLNIQLQAANPIFHLFEPQSNLKEILAHNASLFGGQLHTYGLSALAQEEKVKLYNSARFEGLENSIKFREGFQTQEGEEILLKDAGTVANTLDISSIDVLKIDTEGCEVQILFSLIRAKINMGIIFLEYHSEKDRRSIDTLLGETHFLCTAMVTQPHRGFLAYLPLSFGDKYDLNKYAI